MFLRLIVGEKESANLHQHVPTYSAADLVCRWRSPFDDIEADVQIWAQYLFGHF